MTTISARIRSEDGKVVRVLPDGREEVLEAEPVRSMSDAEVLAAALSDPDARPVSAGDVSLTHPGRRTKIIRRALGLSQEAFAARYQIPVGTLRDWEQERVRPDQPAQAYLRAIAGDPQGVAKALGRQPA